MTACKESRPTFLSKHPTVKNSKGSKNIGKQEKTDKLGQQKIKDVVN